MASFFDGLPLNHRIFDSTNIVNQTASLVEDSVWPEVVPVTNANELFSRHYSDIVKLEYVSPTPSVSKNNHAGYAHTMLPHIGDTASPGEQGFNVFVAADRNKWRRITGEVLIVNEFTEMDLLVIEDTVNAGSSLEDAIAAVRSERRLS